MRFTTNTAEAFRVHSSGNISIGSDEESGLLNVEGSINFNGNIRPNPNSTGGSASDPTICVGYDNDTGFFWPSSNTIGFTTLGQERARITSGGYVGLGTTSPAQNLHVSSGGGVTRALIENTDNAAAGAGIQMLVKSGGTIVSNGTIRVDNTDTMQFFNLAGDRMSFNSSGNFGIGAASPSAKLHVDSGTNTTEGSAHVRLESAGYSGFHFLDGTAYYIGQNSASRSLRIYSSAETAGVNLAAGGTSWGTFSDERLKENIQDIGSVIEKIKDIRCVAYTRKDLENAQETIGFIAQDFIGKFDQVLDELKVSDSDEETRYSIRYTETIPVLLKAIQEQQTIIESLEARITALES
jgi:hypothetical protein